MSAIADESSTEIKIKAERAIPVGRRWFVEMGEPEIALTSTSRKADG